LLANLFDMAPVINSIKDGLIPANAISGQTLANLKSSFTLYLEDIFGLQSPYQSDNSLLQGVMQLLIDIRKESRAKKDFATSDKIRNQLSALGILIKDEKDGNMSWSLS